MKRIVLGLALMAAFASCKKEKGNCDKVISVEYKTKLIDMTGVVQYWVITTKSPDGSTYSFETYAKDYYKVGDCKF